MKTFPELSDPELLDAIMPPGVTLPEQHRRVLAPAVAGCARHLGRIPGRPGKARILRTAARSVRRGGEKEAYLALLDAAPSIVADDPAERMVRIEMLEKLGRSEDVRAALRSDQGIEDPVLVPQLLALRQRHKIRTDAAFVSSLFGPVRPTFAEMLRHLPVERWKTGALEADARALHALAKPAAIPEEEYVDRLVWGHCAAYLHHALSMPVSPGLRPLSRSIARHTVARFDAAVLRPAVAEGRSIVAIGVHGGIPNARQKYLRGLYPGLPSYSVGTKGLHGNGGGNRKAMVVRASPTDFLKLIREIREKPHGIALLPDGPAGAQTTISLFGRDVTMGSGASAIAWHGRADVYFIETVWRADGRLELMVTRGPAPGDHDDRKTYAAALEAFYAERLRMIVAERPENIGTMGGGIWPQLLRQARSNRRKAR